MMADLVYTYSTEGGGGDVAEFAALTDMEQGKVKDSFTARRAREVHAKKVSSKSAMVGGSLLQGWFH